MGNHTGVCEQALLWPSRGSPLYELLFGVAGISILITIVYQLRSLRIRAARGDVAAANQLVLPVYMRILYTFAAAMAVQG